MKIKTFTLMLMSLFAIASYAQIVVDVAPNGLDSSNPPLNEVILAKDTTNSEALVFILEPNGLYILSNTMRASNDITIKAGEGEGYKPVIVMGTNDEGAQNAWDMGFMTGDNMVLEGIQFMCANELHQRGGWANGGIQIKAGMNVTVNNCIIDHIDAAFIAAWAGGVGDFTFTNNMVRWAGGPYSGNWHGYVLDSKNGPAGDVLIQNNTFIEGMASVFTMDGSHYINSVMINHNTFVNIAVWPLTTPYAKEQLMMNNLFVNVGFGGLSISWWAGGSGDPGEEGRGIIDYDTFPEGEDTTTYLLHGETLSNPPETERLSLAAYNNNYITPEVKAWHESDKGLLSSVDTANGGGWWVKADAPPGSNGFMTQTMWGRFEDDATYPYLYWDTDHSTYTLDPGFTNYPTSEDDVIAFARYMCSDPDESYQDNLNFETGGWGIGPEGATLTFPVDEDVYDLSYTNAELLCAAYGGYPLGDLNWFPDLKAQWENDANKENYQSLVAAVKDGEIALSDQCAAVSVFEREVENAAGINIYPNPATELLHIEGAEGELKTIYSITGQKLLQSRENQINISNLRSGLYLIKIGNAVQKFNVK